MRPQAAALLLVLLATTAVARGSGQAPSATQTAAAVHVPVWVREGPRAVAGLGGADFVVTDNGEAQTVEVVGFERVPVDVTLIFDTRNSAANVVSRVASDLQQIERQLRKGDRLRLLRVDTFVEELRPMAAPGSTTPGVTWRSNGLSSLHDALISALVRPSASDREQLIVALIDGFDTASATSADRVRDVAARSDALLQLVSIRPSPSRAAPMMVRPRFRDASLLVLAEAAEQTGGELRTPGLFGDPDLLTSFTRAFDEFRQGYVLRYTPADVEREGWHELAVTVPRAPDATVRVRRGYYSN